MSLATYGGLKAAVVDWALQGASGVTAAVVASDIFPQAQSMMYFGDGDGRDGLVRIPPLRVRAMIASGVLTPDTNGQVTISTGVHVDWLDFVQIVPVTNIGAPPCQYLEPYDFQTRQSLLAYTATPIYYTVEGDTLSTAPKGSSAYTLAAVWHQKFTALSSDGDTDWVLTNAPQVYLNGCLMLAAGYGMDDAIKAERRSAFAAAIAALNLNNAAAKRSGSPLRAVPGSVA